MSSVRARSVLGRRFALLRGEPASCRNRAPGARPDATRSGALWRRAVWRTAVRRGLRILLLGTGSDARRAGAGVDRVRAVVHVRIRARATSGAVPMGAFGRR